MPASPYSAQRTARLLSAAASDNATLVKSTSGTVKRIAGYNAKASAVYLKLYDKSSAPTSADTPRKTYYLPASTAFALDMDDFYGSGIGYRITTGSADNDTGVLVAGDILGLNIDYL